MKKIALMLTVCLVAACLFACGTDLEKGESNYVWFDIDNSQNVGRKDEDGDVVTHMTSSGIGEIYFFESKQDCSVYAYKNKTDFSGFSNGWSIGKYLGNYTLTEGGTLCYHAVLSGVGESGVQEYLKIVVAVAGKSGAAGYAVYSITTMRSGNADLKYRCELIKSVRFDDSVNKTTWDVAQYLDEKWS